MELQETITCPICSVERKSLNGHFQKVHNLSLSEAKEKFNLEYVTSEAYRFSRQDRGNSFYGKHHSDESKDQMIRVRDGKSYKGKIERGFCLCGCGKRVKTPGSRYWRGHAVRGLLVGDKNPARRPEVRAKIRRNHPANTGNDSVRSARISKAKMGKPRYDMRGSGNPAKRPEVRKKISENNPMKRPEIVRKQIASAGKKPNFVESYLFNFISLLLPGQYALNVAARFLVLEGKVPDYVCLEERKIIELFGERWHKTEEAQKRVNFFRSRGWDCLIIWARELKDCGRLRRRILKFHTKKTFNDCNRGILRKMVGQSELYSDIEKLAEMTSSPLVGSGSNKTDIPMFATPTLITSDLFAQKGFMSAAGFKIVNAGLFTEGDITNLGS